jgi:hypothetical protein
VSSNSFLHNKLRGTVKCKLDANQLRKYLGGLCPECQEAQLACTREANMWYGGFEQGSSHSDQVAQSVVFSLNCECPSV